MRFDDWMTSTGTGNATFGEKIGKSAEAVRRYRSGERAPSTKMMALIFEQTDGDVTPNDWAGVGPRSGEAEAGATGT